MKGRKKEEKGGKEDKKKKEKIDSDMFHYKRYTFHLRFGKITDKVKEKTSSRHPKPKEPLLYFLPVIMLHISLLDCGPIMCALVTLFPD